MRDRQPGRVRGSTRRIAVALWWLLTPTEAIAQGLFEEAVGQSRPAPTEGKREGARTAPDAPPATTAVIGGLGFELNGYLRGDLYLGKIPDQRSTETKAGYGELSLQARVRKGSYGDAFGEVVLRSGYQAGETEVSVDLSEAYVDLYLGPFDLRAGHQIIVWGRADGVNPTNNLTPRDLRERSPVEDDMRLANLALRTHYNREPLRWELVWVPFYAPAHFPRFDLPDGIALAETQGPSANVRNGTIASRLHLLWPAIELSLSYLAGTSTFPGIALQSVEPASASGPPAVTVAFATYRHQVIGADFSTALGHYGLRGEFAYRRAFDYATTPHAPLPDLQLVLGIDRELFGQLNIIAQYHGRVVFDWNHDPVTEADPPLPLLQALALTEVVQRNRMIASQLERVQHAATLRLEWKLLQEALRLELLGMGNFSTEELLLRPKVAYDIADALTVTVGAEIYLGAEGTLFGLIDETQSAGYAEVRASF